MENSAMWTKIVDLANVDSEKLANMPTKTLEIDTEIEICTDNSGVNTYRDALIDRKITDKSLENGKKALAIRRNIQYAKRERVFSVLVLNRYRILLR